MQSANFSATCGGSIFTRIKASTEESALNLLGGFEVFLVARDAIDLGKQEHAEAVVIPVGHDRACDGPICSPDCRFLIFIVFVRLEQLDQSDTGQAVVELQATIAEVLDSPLARCQCKGRSSRYESIRGKRAVERGIIFGANESAFHKSQPGPL